MPLYVRTGEDADINQGCDGASEPDSPELDGHPSMPEDWVALVRRGACGFADKVRYAQRLGALAVIVGDDALHGGLGGTVGSPLTGMWSPCVLLK